MTMLLQNADGQATHPLQGPINFAIMELHNFTRRGVRALRLSSLAAGILALGIGHLAGAQDTPLLSGGVGFFTNTPGGNTSAYPVLEPLAAVPIGPHLLIESRAALLETWSPNGQGGYDHTHFIGLTYLQGDYVASPHLTAVVGSYLLPFGTYNERLSPIWIGNFQDGPLIASLGLLSTGTGLGRTVARQRDFPREVLHRLRNVVFRAECELAVQRRTLLWRALQSLSP